jgi:hypothetical protein
MMLRDCVVNVSELIRILEYTGYGLETLAIVGGPTTMVTDRLFQHLTTGTDRSDNVTQLTSFTLSGSFEFETTALVEMLEIRVGSHASLVMVHGFP